MARPAGYDPEVEKQRLAFEQMKWEEEQKRWQIEMEEKKKKEGIEMEERKKKEEIETEGRKRREYLEAEQLDLKRRELERQLIRYKIEDERRDNAVTKGKLFGDAMRASAIKMGGRSH